MLRRLSPVSDDLTPTAAVGGGISTGTRRPGGGYCSFIQRISIFSTLNKPALFIQSGNRSSGSSGSSSSDGSETETPPSDVSPDACFKKHLRSGASSGLDELACQMARDVYTRGLIQAFSGASERGADDVLKSWFSELDVDWVLGIGETNLVPAWEAFDGLIQRWIRAVTVMAKVFDMMRSDLHDQSSSGQLGLPTVVGETRSRSAPVTVPGRPSPPSCTSSVSDSSKSTYGTSDSSLSSSSSLSVASVREAMAAFSLADTGAGLVGGMDEPLQPEAPQFAEFAMASVLKMLAFADAVAGVEKTLENLLRALDVYASISDHTPVLLQLFSGLHKEIVSRKIQSVVQLLSDAIRAMIRDVKACLAAGDSLGVPQGGDIHKTTRCAMRDIKLLLHDYGYLDLDVFAVAQNKDDGCVFSLDMEGPRTLSDLLVELIYCLEDLLEEKSKMYPDPGLRYMFLLNNSNFILQQVESMDDQPCLVPFRKHKQRIERYIERYIESSWLRVLSCLPSPSRDGWLHRSRRCLPSLVKFNSEFERTYGAHKHWKVPCPQLRGRLRAAVAARVVGEYSRHLASYSELTSSAGYTPQEMEELLLELFEG